MARSFLISSYLYMCKTSGILFSAHIFPSCIGKHIQNKHKRYINIHFIEDDSLPVRDRADRGLPRRRYDSFLSQLTLSQANVISVMECSDHTHPCTHSLTVIPLLGGTTEPTHTLRYSGVSLNTSLSRGSHSCHYRLRLEDSWINLCSACPYFYFSCKY